ncbi:MAG: molecular chaperone DnaK [Acidobacteria bacterium]|nr:MAG: molecular chaperone DnaK [Acidobacteriota bacterium]
MSRIVGIDLGTTNSVVAVMEGDKPVVIPTKEGSHTVPSIVAFSRRGERLVGPLAKRQAATNPEGTFYGIKRLIGRKRDDKHVEGVARHVPYAIVAAPNGDAHVRVGDRVISPQEISAAVLAHLKENAEQYLGEKVQDAVITVPAYFDDTQRQATRDAGRIAGLNVLRILNEPTAASLAYGLLGEEETEKVIAVYDLGGGTFDISILRLAQGVFEVLATAGDTFLGGEDFDQRIIEWLAAGFKEQTGVDPLADRLALQRLKEAAEKAKCELSRETQADIQLPFLATTPKGPTHLNTTLTREKFEELVADLVEKTRRPCEEALEMAGLSPSDIDDVLLVGGQTRTPLVQRMVQQIFGREANKDVNPDEVVALGAAIQAGILCGDVKEIVLLDVTPLSLGVETRDGGFIKMIERGATVPCRRSRVFTTTADNQTKVEIHVLQGEREIAAANKSLARFELVGIPPAPRGTPQIEVTFDIDSNGIVSVSAKDLSSGLEQQVVVTPTSGLTPEEIERAIAEAEMFAEEDRRRLAASRAKARLEGLLETNRRTYKEFEQLLSPEQRQEIKQVFARCKTALASEDATAIQQALDMLGDVARILSDVALYDPTSVKLK